MANEQNLKSMRDMTASEQREIASKGGIASGKARRERKLLRDTLLDLIEKGNMQDNICTALLEKAMNGDTKAFEVLRDTMGQKPVEKQEIKQVDTDWFIDEE